MLDQRHHFVFLIENVPVRFFRGSADEPTARTLRRQIIEAQQLTMGLGEEQAEGLALEATASGSVARVVFLALRGEDGQVECFWPVPLDNPPETGGPEPTQLRLLGKDATDVLVMVRPAEKPVRRRGKPRLS